MRHFLAAFLILLSPTAFAQVACADHDDAVAHLAAEYGEQSVAMGLTSDGNVIEILASSDGGTFTIIVTDTDKRSCLATSGTAYFAVEFTPPGESS